MGYIEFISRDGLEVMVSKKQPRLDDNVDGI